MPNVRSLDFQKVSLKEKIYAKNLFDSERGKKIIEDMLNKKFTDEDEADYVMASEKIQKDLDKQKTIYVRFFYLEHYSICYELRRS